VAGEGEAAVFDEPDLDVAVADDMAAGDAVALAQERDHGDEGVELRLGRGLVDEVAIDDHADAVDVGVFVVVVALLFADAGVGADAVDGAALVDDAVSADDVVVADVGEAADLEVVPLQRQRAGGVFEVRVVHDDERRRRQRARPQGRRRHRRGIPVGAGHDGQPGQGQREDDHGPSTAALTTLFRATAAIRSIDPSPGSVLSRLSSLRAR
jgi:hypothetical protein